jgi:hypothetical protein
MENYICKVMSKYSRSRLMSLLGAGKELKYQTAAQETTET